MAECLTVQEISNIAGGSSTSSNFPNVNECPNKTEAESNWKVTVTDDASTDELVTSAKKATQRVSVHFVKGSRAYDINLHLDTSVGDFDFTDNEHWFYVDVPYDETALTVYKLTGNISLPNAMSSWGAVIGITDQSSIGSTDYVWSKRNIPWNKVEYIDITIDKTYDLGSSDPFVLYVESNSLT